jgi:4-aminobutyrate aminotransferase-like enzyme
MLNRPAVFFRRRGAFTSTESAGTDLSGSWTETSIMRRDMAAYQDASNTLAFFEVGGSKGSFVTDVDGNTLLDMCSMENLPLGHNHPELLKAIGDASWDASIMNSSVDTSQRVAGDLLDKAITSLTATHASMSTTTLTSESSAVEQAIFAAMATRGHGKRSSVVGFTNTSTEDAIASFGWPMLDFPTSAGEEAQTLEAVRSALHAQKEAGCPVAAIVVEPTSSKSGHVLSSDFLSQLHRLGTESEAALIVDETSTGCGASGQGFWQYDGPSDYVAFGKRTQVSGFMAAGGELVPESVGGSPLALKQWQVVNNVVHKEFLADRVAKVSHAMARRVEGVSNDKISAIRASGTSLWIDTASQQSAQSLRAHLASQGVLVKANGTRGVMAKPALTLEEHQAEALFAALSSF